MRPTPRTIAPSSRRSQVEAEEEQADRARRDTPRRREADRRATPSISSPRWRSSPRRSRRLPTRACAGSSSGRAARCARRSERSACRATSAPPSGWKNRRVLIFTEYADTKRYLEQQLKASLGWTDQGDDRLATFHGGMGTSSRGREARVQRRPAKHPLRILIATDAAREGVNLQNHCADLIHFDCRGTRAPGAAQRPHRPQAAARRRGPSATTSSTRSAPRTACSRCSRAHPKVIQEELGSMPPVLEERMTHALARGIGPRATKGPRRGPRARTPPSQRARCDRRARGNARVERRRLSRSSSTSCATSSTSLEKALDLNEGQLRTACSCESLGMLHAPLLKPPATKAEDRSGLRGSHARPIALAQTRRGPTRSTRCAVRARGMKHLGVAAHRAHSPRRLQRPRAHRRDVVHLHLEHRLVQRLLGRFLAQGFVLDDLARACVGQTDDAVPRVLSSGGSRSTATARRACTTRWSPWPRAGSDPTARKGGLKPYAEDAQEEAWDCCSHRSPRAQRPQGRPEVSPNMLRGHVSRRDRNCFRISARCEHARRQSDREAQRARPARGRGDGGDPRGQKGRIERSWPPRLKIRSRPSSSRASTTQEREQLKRQREVLAAPPRGHRARASSSRAHPAKLRGARDRIEPVGIAYLWPVTG
jgi:hypothetical protein